MEIRLEIKDISVSCKVGDNLGLSSISNKTHNIFVSIMHARYLVAHSEANFAASDRSVSC